MVRIFGLQGAHQDLEFRKTAHTLQANVPHEKWPARKSAADALFKPLKGQRTAAQQRIDASDLIVGMVGVPEGFGATAGASHTLQRLFSAPRQGPIDTQQ